MAFQYSSALPSGSIRLLKFEAAEKSFFGLQSKPQLSIQAYTFETAPKYSALSYTWGPPRHGVPGYKRNQMVPILLNKQPFLVYPNLMNAIKMLQKNWDDFKGQVYHFWADAICINQNDEIEKAIQIDAMDQVYSKAYATLVWLGDKTNKTKIVLDLVDRIAKAGQKLQGRELPYNSPADFPNELVFKAYSLPYPLTHPKEWIYLLEFMNLKWFSRLWIVQEVMLSKALYVFWGEQKLDWTSFQSALDFLTVKTALSGWLRLLPKADEMHKRDEYSDSMKLIKQLELLRAASKDWKKICTSMNEVFNYGPGSSAITANMLLMSFAVAYRGSEATEPRDKIFGHLGIINSVVQQAKISPCRIQAKTSHLLSAVELYQEVVVQVIEETQSLFYLTGTCDGGAAPRMAGLPSWVPDFSLLLSIHKLQSLSKEKEFHAAEIAGESPRSDLRVDGKRLFVTGHEFDTVQALIATEEDFSGLDHTSWIARLANYMQSTGRDSVDDFWRTIICNTINDAYNSRWGNIPDFEPFRCYLLVTITEAYKMRHEWDIGGRNNHLYSLKDFHRLESLDRSGIIPRCHHFLELRDSLKARPGVPLTRRGDPNEILKKLLQARASKFRLALSSGFPTRSCFVSSRGFFLNVPKFTKVGDKIVLVKGSPCPLILRPAQNQEGRWSVIGAAYVHGIMHGQAAAVGDAWGEYCIC
jgi:hypothetical protein